MIIWLLVGICGSIWLIIIGSLSLSWWLDFDNGPIIKFKSFKNFYELNPDRWKLYDSHVACKTESEHIVRSIYRECYDDLKFGFIDSCRYKYWKHSLDKRKQEKYNTQVTARMIAAVKQDIAASEEKAQKYQNEAAQTLWTVVNRS